MFSPGTAVLLEIPRGAKFLPGTAVLLESPRCSRAKSKFHAWNISLLLKIPRKEKVLAWDIIPAWDSAQDAKFSHGTAVLLEIPRKVKSSRMGSQSCLRFQVEQKFSHGTIVQIPSVLDHSSPDDPLEARPMTIYHNIYHGYIWQPMSWPPPSGRLLSSPVDPSRGVAYDLMSWLPVTTNVTLRSHSGVKSPGSCRPSSRRRLWLKAIARLLSRLPMTTVMAAPLRSHSAREIRNQLFPTLLTFLITGKEKVYLADITDD